MTVTDLEPRVNEYNDPVPQAQAEALGAKIMAAAADVAKQDAVFLELVGEFDALDAAGWWSGIQSTAHWLSWACSIASGTAREHVRVARALRRMPITREAFGIGELTYSKVREITRVADKVDQDDLDEAGLVEFARACTASQLARTVSGWRAAKGTSRERRSRQRVSWVIQSSSGRSRHWPRSPTITSPPGQRTARARIARWLSSKSALLPSLMLVQMIRDVPAGTSQSRSRSRDAGFAEAPLLKQPTLNVRCVTARSWA